MTAASAAYAEWTRPDAARLRGRCAPAVVLPRGAIIEGLNDSKKLSEKRREALFDEICDKALEYSIAFASVEEIEELNILNATFLAMNRAISGLGTAPELALAIVDEWLDTDFEGGRHQRRVDMLDEM